MGKNTLLKGIIYIFIANVINMLLGLINNFILPKYLSFNTYADIKTFALLMSIAGILHLGYEDGVYLKYGGKEIKDVNKDELWENISTLRIFQTIVSIFIMLISFFTKNLVVFLFGCMILPYNMCMYFRNFFSAVGKFKMYGKILNFASILIFISNIYLLFFLKTDLFYNYLLNQIFVYTIIWLYGEYYICRTTNTKIKIISFSIKEMIENIKCGFFFMVGNFASILLTSMDRWFVKFFFNNQVFAQYSFAVSTENFLNIAVSPVSTTFYNLFCKNNKVDDIVIIKRLIVILSPFIVSIAFIGDWIIRIILDSYIGAIKVIYLLFGSQIFIIINKCIYVNLYKAQKKQNKYFQKIVIVVLFGLFSNFVAHYYLEVMEAFAIATLLSSVLWLCLSQLDFPDQKLSPKEVIYLTFASISFIVMGFEVKQIEGFLCYIFEIIILVHLIFYSDLVKYRKIIREILIKR